MGRLKPLRYREVVRRLRAVGFAEVSQRGSHVKFAKITDEGTRIAIVPKHSVDIPLGTLRSILNQAGITPDDFDRL